MRGLLSQQSRLVVGHRVIIYSFIDEEEVGVVVEGLRRCGHNCRLWGSTDPHDSLLRVAEPRNIGSPSFIFPSTDLV